MDNKTCGKMQPVVRKVEKMQVKYELDRIKQAEKKKRRLEKALATSTAIHSKLEQKKEEQQRLDEEGAAIAEAVALHVLLGEDSDASCKIMLNREEGRSPWDYASNFDLFWVEVELAFLIMLTRTVKGGPSMRIESDASALSWETLIGLCHTEFMNMHHTLRMEAGAVRNFQLVLLQHRLFHHSRLRRMQR